MGVWEQPEGSYERGVVYYLAPAKGGSRVVGVLTWGIPGRLDDARRLIKRGDVFSDRAALKHAIPFLTDEQLDALENEWLKEHPAPTESHSSAE
ncbi:MAG TPA: hypothetical protein V6D20_02855 [Candidatus Obscuribacterales bacterium]